VRKHAACGEPLELLRESNMLRPGTGRGPELPDRATSRRTARTQTSGLRRTSRAFASIQCAATGDRSRSEIRGPRDVPARIAYGNQRRTANLWSPCVNPTCCDRETGRGPELPDRATSRRAACTETSGVRRTSGAPA